MHRLLGSIFTRFFADKNGISRGWQVFLFLTLIGIGLTAWLAWKAGGPKQPHFHGSMYVVLPLMFAAVGGMLWVADIRRRHKFARQEAATGIAVDTFMAEVIAKNSRSAGWIAAVLGVAFIPLVMWKVGAVLVKEYSSAHWTPTTCRVTNYEVNKPWNNYVFRITVAYTVNNVHLEAEVTAPTASAVRSAAEAQWIESQFKPGSEHQLYVNPLDPREVSLRRGPSVGTVIATVTMPIGGLCLILVSVRFMERHWPRRRSIASGARRPCATPRERLELFCACVERGADKWPTVDDAQYVGSFRRNPISIQHGPDLHAHEPIHWARWAGYNCDVGNGSLPCSMPLAAKAKQQDTTKSAKQADAEGGQSIQTSSVTGPFSTAVSTRIGEGMRIAAGAAGLRLAVCAKRS